MQPLQASWIIRPSKRTHSTMRRIDPDEPSSSSGGALYPRPLQAQAATAQASAAPPVRAPFSDIVIRRMTFLGGPGIWTYRPVIEAVVDIGALEEHPSNTLPGFYDRLTAWLPGLIEHRCSVGRRGGFLMRLRDGTWPGHILEHVALELQTQAGMKTGFGKARMTGEHGVYKVVIRTREESIGKAAITAARDLVMAAINDTPHDVAATVARLAEMVDRRCLGPSTARIVDAAAEAEGSEVIVERCIPGQEHRVLVVGNKVVAAMRGEIIHVKGDGRSSIGALIDLHVNTDPRRGEEEHLPLETLRHDDAVLQLLLRRQGLGIDSVLPVGQSAVVQRTGNMSIDVTDQVHPDVAELVALAARVVGLDIAGIDLVAEDIGQPLGPQGGAIVEVNAGPGLLMHLKPGVGKPRPVGQAIVGHLFPNGTDGRIPLVGVSGSHGKTTVCHLIARLLTLSGKHTGLASSNGLFLDRRRSSQRDCANWESAHRILLNRAVEAAVLENGGDSVLTEGLAYDRCQIGVITNVDPARHLGRLYIETEKQLFNLMRTQVDLVLKTGAAVLNAKDPMLVEMAELCDGETIFFAHDAALPAITAHLENGHRAVIVRYGQVMLASAQGEIALARLADVPICEGGANHEQVENVLAAVAAAWALGIPTDIMRTGIETFIPEHDGNR